MNIQDITFEQASVAVLFIVGFIGGVKYLRKEIEDFLKEFLNKTLDSRFETVNNKLDEMQKTIDKLDLYTTKNFIVRFLSDVEREDCIFEQEKQRFWEEYDHYTKELGENSYIKQWVKRLIRDGKLEQPGDEEE